MSKPIGYYQDQYGMHPIFPPGDHNHDGLYLGISAKAADSDKLDNHDSTYFSISTHNHTGVYLPIAGKAADSEKVDNINGASLLRSDVNDNFSGTLNYTPDTGVILQVDGKTALQRHTVNGALSLGADDALVLGCGEARATVVANVNMVSEITYLASDNNVYLIAALQGGWAARKEAYLSTDGQFYVGGSKVWKGDNDGSGSGLDADKLDGQHGSYYAISTHNHSGVYLPIAGKAADSSKLNNAVESVAAGNNTIVKRHASGYIYTNYFNTTPNNVGAVTPTAICVETGGDGFIRHQTIANLATALSPYLAGSPAYKAILTSGTAQTWNAPHAGVFKVTVIGGGGGGGNADGTSSNAAHGSGAGGGSMAIRWYTLTNGKACTYTVGAGGAASGNGGSSTFTDGTTAITAGGGVQGKDITGGTATPGGAGGTASNGEMNVNGREGNEGGGDGGHGGHSSFGFGGIGESAAGQLYGGGGAGAYSRQDGPYTYGGVGAAGVIIIEAVGA